MEDHDDIAACFVPYLQEDTHRHTADSSDMTGFPSPASSHEALPLDLHQHLVKHPASTFFMRVSATYDGDLPGICAHDLLIVDRSLRPSHHALILAVEQNEIRLQRFISQHATVLVWGVVSYVIHAT